MLDAAILQRVRQLHFVTKRLMDGPLVGDDITARRGYGIEFHQIREYQAGDDVRFIDWRGSARLGRLLTKECLQERNRTVIVAVDVSASSLYGSVSARIEKLREVAAILLFAAHHARDSVGLLLCADQLALQLPPKNISSYVHVLIEHLYTYQPHVRTTTNLTNLCDHIARACHKDALVFIVSDFIDDHFKFSLQAAARQTDVVCVRCLDAIEHTMPIDSIVLTRDIETNQAVLVDMGGAAVKRVLAERVAAQNEVFAHIGVDVLDISEKHDACVMLIEFFKRRMIHNVLRAW